jgi:hypothetical protein
MAAGEGDEDVFEADVPGGQAGERAVLGIDAIEERGDGAMGFGDGQRVAFGFEAGTLHAREIGKALGGKRGGAVDLFECEFDDMFTAHASDELSRWAERDDLAVVHDRDAVAEALGFVHVVGGEERGSALPLKVASYIPELAA